MPPPYLSEEWNKTCAIRPATIRDESQVLERYRQFNYFLIAFCAVYYAIGLVAFGIAKKKAKSSYIAKRNFIALWFCAISITCMIIVGPLRDIIGRQDFSCSVMLWSRIGAVTFALLPVASRIIFFREQLMWANAKKSISFQKLQEIIQSDQELPSSTSTRKSIFSKLSSVQSGRFDSTDLVPRKDSMEDFEHKLQSEAGSQISESRKGMSSASSSMDEKEFERLMRRQSLGFKIAILAIPAAPLLILGIVWQTTLPYYRAGCHGCYEEAVFHLTTGATVALIIVLTAFAAWMVRKNPDPLGLLREIKWVILIGAPLGFLGLFGDLIDQYINRPYDRGVFSFDWIVMFALMHVFTCLAYVPLINAYKMQQTVLSARYDFQSFLTNSKALKLFTEHLVNEWAVENIKFWSQVESFRNANFKKIRDGNLVAWQTFNTFIRPGAVLDVNIPSSVRESLMKYFEDHMAEDPDFSKKQIPQTLFDEAQHEVFLLMEKDSFQRFQNTKSFKQFASEHTVLDTAKQKLVVVAPGGAGV